MNVLEEGLAKIGIEPTEKQWVQLKTYIEELERWNDLYSLVNATGDTLIIRHILDSLAGLKLIGELLDEREKTMADMGSGGGLPGIPLAIFLPHVQIDLVERSGKRTDFLRNMTIQLDLSNVTVENKDLKQVNKSYDLITFRAFRPFLPEIIKGLKKTLKPRGVVSAYKGKLVSIEEEKTTLKEHFSHIRVEPIKVPYLKEERHLLILGND